MVATLPALTNIGPAHKISDTEWAQLLNALKSLSNIAQANFYGSMSASTTSASFVNVTGATMSGFVKQQGSSGSDLLAIHSMSARASATTVAGFGINDGTTDWATITAGFNTAGKHNCNIGLVKMTGLAAGGYTFVSRIKSNGTNTMTIDTNDCGFIIMIEVPK